MLYSRVTSGVNELYIPITKVHAYQKTDYATISIVDLEGYGKSLLLDNEIQTSATCFFDYHYHLVFPHSAKEGEKAVILGAGEGVSTHLLTLCGYTPENLTAVDIDPIALDLYKEHISDWNKDIYKRTDEFQLHIGDALAYLKSLPDESVQYIIYDLDSVAQRELTKECVKEAHRVLSENGVLSCQDGPMEMESITYQTSLNHFKNHPFVQENNGWRFSHYVKEGKQVEETMQEV